MSQHTNTVPMEADPFSELLEKPGCYIFEPFDGAGSRVLGKDDIPPLRIDGSVRATETGYSAHIGDDGLHLPDATADTPKILQDFGDNALNENGRYHHGHGHTLLGGIAIFETEENIHSGIFISRKVLLMMSAAVQRSAIAPNTYARIGRPAPAEVSALARILPYNNTEKSKEITYSLTRNSILNALRSAAVIHREAALNEVVVPMPVREQAPGPIAA